MNKNDTLAAYSDFTKWCRDNPHLDLDSRPHSHGGPIGDGGYISNEKTRVAFAAWRAAIEADRQASEPVCGAPINNKEVCGEQNVIHVPQNKWEAAIGHELANTMNRTTDSFKTPAEAIAALIDWNIKVATDPAVNGGYKLVPIDPTAQDIAGREIVEAITKAILFEDCGSTEDWQDNLNLGKAAIRAMVEHIPVEMGAEEWVELHVLRAERGPSDDGHNTWKDAAIAERTKRVNLTPKKEIVELAKEGLSVYTSPNQNEHKICAEIVRLGAMFQAAPEPKEKL